MSDDEIRIAMAGACPSVIVRTPGAAGWNYKHPNGRVLPCIDGDPLKDLNAMNAVERTLTASQFANYAPELMAVIIGRETPNPDWLNSQFPSSRLAMVATAGQRAEAFLRTIGKWKGPQ